MTHDDVAAALAARTAGPWSVGRGQDGATYDGEWWPQVWPALGAPVADLNGRPGAKEKDRADARAIVVAVNLADPLWRVAEAIE